MCKTVVKTFSEKDPPPTQKKYKATFDGIFYYLKENKINIFEIRNKKNKEPPDWDYLSLGI